MVMTSSHSPISGITASQPSSAASTVMPSRCGMPPARVPVTRTASAAAETMAAGAVPSRAMRKSVQEPTVEPLLRGSARIRPVRHALRWG